MASENVDANAVVVGAGSVYADATSVVDMYCC